MYLYFALLLKAVIHVADVMPNTIK